MNQQPRIPDPETRKREVEKLRCLSKQIEAFNLKLDEIIAQLEAGIREQRRTRLGLNKKESRSA